MSLFDLISSALGLDTGNWQDRLKGDIELTSPEGDDFKAFWVGNPRSGGKKLGLFNFPGIQGTKVQDLESTGDRYPLTIFFTGKNYDTDSTSFYNACKQKGTWLVTHPEKGFINLQMISYSEDIQPVTSAGLRKFELDMIEPLPDSAETGSQFLAGSIDDQASLNNFQAAAQFGLNVVQDTLSEFNALTGAIGKGITAVKTTLSAAENFELIPAEITAIISGIESTIQSFPLDTDVLASQVQELVQTYSSAQNTTSEVLEMYSNFNRSISGIAPSTPDSEGKNTAAVQELFSSASITAMALSTSVGGEKTRAESLLNGETITDALTSVTESLDSIQTLYSDSPLVLQYFSQSQSYSDAIIIVSLANQLILTQSFDLAIEKRFNLVTDRNPVEITAAEYGDLESLDLFLESNDVTGNQFFIMPAGTEVVVYV